MPKIKIVQKNKGQRLDVFLAEKFVETSRSQWQKRIKRSEVTVNGKQISVHYKLKEGDRVEILNSSQAQSLRGAGQLPNKLQNKNSELKKIKIIFESDDYIIINKPAGLVVHPDNINKQAALTNWLMERYPEIKGLGDNGRPGIVHRLDKQVSGLMAVARTQAMFEHLKTQFKERKVNKEYMALVHNRMQQDEGEVKLPIGRSKKTGIFVAMDNMLEGLIGGRQALTKYEVVKRFGKFTLIKIKILTGRTHQIRVHMRAIGHSIVGDKLYMTHDIKKKKKWIDLARLWLYAAKLGFKDLAGEWVEYELKMPRELKLFLNKLK